MPVLATLFQTRGYSLLALPEQFTGGLNIEPSKTQWDDSHELKGPFLFDTWDLGQGIWAMVYFLFMGLRLSFNLDVIPNKVKRLNTLASSS